jgi:hypothetical protein
LEQTVKNILKVFKISASRVFTGIFILFISTQTFAICDSELQTAVNKGNDRADADLRRIHPFLLRERGRNSVSEIQSKIESSKEYIVYLNNSKDFSAAYREQSYTYHLYMICMNESELDFIRNRTSDTSNATRQQQSQQQSNQSQPQRPQQSQQLTQQNHQRSSDAEELAASNRIIGSQKQSTQEFQQKADQARQGKRRRHEPENEASHCIQPDFGGLYGGMKNTCNFKVWYTYCGYRPSERSWLTGMNCEKQSFGSDSVMPGNTSASHTHGVQQLYWFACKEPAWPLDHEFVVGSGIRARCYTVGGN